MTEEPVDEGEPEREIPVSTTHTSLSMYFTHFTVPITAKQLTMSVIMGFITYRFI